MKNALIGDEGATSAVEGFYTNYAEYMEQVRQETDDTISKVNELIQKYAELASAESNSNSSTGNNSGNNSGTGTDAGGGNKTDKPQVVNPDVPRGTSPEYKNVKDSKKIGNTYWYQLEGNPDWYSSSALDEKNGQYKIKIDIADGKNKVYNGDMINL